MAPGLLGCVLEHETAGGRIAVELTEVEAYAGAADAASHAYRGQTSRNAVMFGPPGHAYVYFTYGMHFCVNVVCAPRGTAAAVLLRAGRVIAGERLARLGRAALAEVPPRDLARGPARLCRALGIDRGLNGADLCAPGSALRLRAPDGVSGDASGDGQGALIESGPRVGVSAAADVPWRFWRAGEPTVSPYRAYRARGRRTR